MLIILAGGGAPFDDMRAGWAKLLKEYPEIDQSRAVAAGASYGGYAINWIQSNPEFGFGFKVRISFVFNHANRQLTWGRPSSATMVCLIPRTTASRRTSSSS
jgi:hypothetical protein